MITDAEWAEQERWYQFYTNGGPRPMAKFTIESEPSDEYPSVDPSVRLVIEETGFETRRHYMTVDQADMLAETIRAQVKIAARRARRYKRATR